MRMEEKNQECEVLNNVAMKPECALNSLNMIDYLRRMISQLVAQAQKKKFFPNFWFGMLLEENQRRLKLRKINGVAQG